MILTWSLGHLLFYDVSINWLNLNKGFASWAKLKIELNCAAFKAHALDDCNVTIMCRNDELSWTVS